MSVVGDDVTITTSVKTKLLWRFGETSLVKFLLGVNPSWDYIPSKKNFSQKVVNISPNGNIHLKSDLISGSILNGLREPVLFVFTSH